MYGIIDIGSNTIRLTVYKIHNKEIQLILNKKHMTGLAGYVNLQGYLTENGINKAIYDLLDFKTILSNFEMKNVFVFATASLRNIKNTIDATKRIEEATGFSIDLISGEQEAHYDFHGATKALNLNRGLLVDIGGGSTELVYFHNGAIDKAISMPFGSLSLYKQFVSDIIPNENEILRMKKFVKNEIKKVEIECESPQICGVGGSIRGCLKLNRELFSIDPLSLEMEPLHLKRLVKQFSKHRSYAVDNILKVTPERIHTIVPGMTILQTIVKRYDAINICVSPYGIREGYLYKKLEEMHIL